MVHARDPAGAHLLFVTYNARFRGSGLGRGYCRLRLFHLRNMLIP